MATILKLDSQVNGDTFVMGHLAIYKKQGILKCTTSAPPT